MRFLVIGLNLVLSLTLTLPVVAQEPVTVPLEHDGRVGVWFVLEEAQRLNALDENTESRRQVIQLLERQLELAVEFEIPARQRAVAAALAIGETWHDVVESATERANEAESRLDSIWRQPILWLTIGLAVGSIVAGFLVSR